MNSALSAGVLGETACISSYVNVCGLLSIACIFEEDKGNNFISVTLSTVTVRHKHS